MIGRLDVNGYDYLLPELEAAEVDIDAVIAKLNNGRNVEIVRILQETRDAVGSPAVLSSIRTNCYGGKEFHQDGAALALAAEASIDVVNANRLFISAQSATLLLKLTNYARGLMKGEMDLPEAAE